MIVLHHCLSARSFRPLWMLEELGAPYELKVLPFPPRVLSRAFLEINPLGTVLSSQLFLCAQRFTAADVSVGYALLLAQHLGLDERFTPAVQGYWQRLQQREGFRRALQAQHEAAIAQHVSTVPAPDTR